jgi:hypothetical protein
MSKEESAMSGSLSGRFTCSEGPTPLEALAGCAFSRVIRDIRKSRTRIDPFNRRLRFEPIVVTM